MKKILSLVLVVAMMASLVVLAPTASAAENGYSIEVTDAGAVTQGTKGLTADIIITTPDTLFTAQLAIDYDKTRIENVVIDTADVKAFPTTGTVDGFPYTMTFFASGTAAVDASAGFTYLTVTYDIKADAPAGDAYIRVAPVPDTTKIYIAPSDATTTATAIYDWTVIEGGATVLPEGYGFATPVLDEADFTYKDNGDGTATLLSYTGEGMEEAWIPSTIAGLTVTALTESNTSYLFEDVSFTTLWIPETVTVINRRAFGADVVTNLYILNKDVKFAHKQSVHSDGVNFFGPAGSTAIDHIDEWCTTEEEYGDWTFTEYDYVPATTVTVVAGDNTSAFEVSGNTIVAPGASRIDGKTVVAWQVGDVAVAPGAAVEITGDTTFTAITVAAPETTYGASVKAADGYAALRFTAEFSVAEYEALVAAFGAKNVKHGMLISTQDQIVAAGEFTHKLAKKLDFDMKGCWKVEDGNYVFAASVKNFSDSTLAKNYKFNAVAYVGVDVDGNGTVDTYVYGDYDWTCARDAKTVLANAIENAATSGLVGDQLTWAEAWFGKFN